MMESNVKRFKYSAVSNIRYHNLEFDWTIKGFDPGDVTQCHSSPAIKLPEETTWHFILNYGNKNTKYRISVKSNSKRHMYVTGEFRYPIICHQNTSDTFETVSTSKAITDGFATVLLSELSFPKGIDLEFHFDLKVYGLLKTESVLHNGGTATENETKCNDTDPEKFMMKIRTMRQNHQTSDVRIQVGKQTTYAHKFILFAMSPVFAAMFRNPTLENSRNVIKVHDVSFEVMDSLLGFMYGEPPDEGVFGDWKKLRDLYYASDKYQVLDLRDSCRNGLVKQMTVEAVWELLELSDRHCDEELKKRVFDFCRVNYQKIVETDGWRSLIENNPLVASSLLKQFPYVSK